MSKKVLVLGRNGQLGSEVIRMLSSSDYDGLCPSEEDADITSSQKIDKVVSEYKPDFIVNCAAFTNVDKCESDLDTALAVNVKGVENCARAALANNATLIHVSTDYVYDGSTGLEKVTHAIHHENERPLNFYGKTKLLGEEAARKILEPEHPSQLIILRTSGLYGIYGNNFLKKMENLLESNEDAEYSVVADQWYCPTSAAQLAQQIKWFIDLTDVDKQHILNIKTNIFNACNTGFTSPYLFLAKYFALREKTYLINRMIPVSFDDYFNTINTSTARRPKAVVLRNDLAERDFCALSSIDEALDEYVFEADRRDGKYDKKEDYD